MDDGDDGRCETAKSRARSRCETAKSSAKSSAKSGTVKREDSRRAVRSLYSETQVQLVRDFKREGGASTESLGAFDEATFKDEKWANAVNFIQSQGLDTEEGVRELLLEGAQSFGLWRVSEATLQSLVSQVLGSSCEKVSPGLSSWIGQSQSAEQRPSGISLSSEAGRRYPMDLRLAQRLTLCGHESKETQAEEDPQLRDGKGGLRPASSFLPAESGAKGADSKCCPGILDEIRWFKRSLALLLIVVSFVYALWVVYVKYEGILDHFMWPIIFARAGGMGTAIITGLMYLSMARSFMKQFYKCLPVNSPVIMILDSHKDVHIFLARCLMVTGGVHVCAHLLSTIPALQYTSCAELNSVLACANRDVMLRGWPSLEWLQWPACPLTQEKIGRLLLFQSTPGVSGLVLVALLLLLGWTGRAAGRAAKFDRFWYAHNAALFLWPVTMFVHGSNQWIGVGFPLVVFTATGPMCLYLADRVRRLLRYYLFAGRVRIASAVIRPGKGGGPQGALTNLAIEKPPGLWTYKPGMYAFVCMPEYAPMQWHPFTICSGKDDERVEFIIAGVGDWTQELASRCLQAQAGEARLPRVALDGPYAAPAQSALSRPILVAVGAGVGITPFLSLMSSLISILEDDSSESARLPLKEAHFFWMTRSADEFLFGRKHFTRIANSDRLRRKVHLHLHTTAREPEGNAAAFLFRQAVRRQSKVDEAAFQDEFDAERVLAAPQLPWCWANSSKLDIVWLSDLTTANCETEEGDESSAVVDDACPPLAGSPSSIISVVDETVFDLDQAQTPPVGDGQTSDEGYAYAVRAYDQILNERRPLPQASAKSLAVEAERRPLPRASTKSLSPRTSHQTQSYLSPRMSHQTQSWARELLRSRSTRPTAPDSLQGSNRLSPLSRNRQVSNRQPTNSDIVPAEEALVPLAFGRPDFECELRAIGRHWDCAEKVHVYVCGNDAIVNGLRSTADILNQEARANSTVSRSSAQKYLVTYERFG